MKCWIDYYFRILNYLHQINEYFPVSNQRVFYILEIISVL